MKCKLKMKLKMKRHSQYVQPQTKLAFMQLTRFGCSDAGFAFKCSSRRRRSYDDQEGDTDISIIIQCDQYSTSVVRAASNPHTPSDSNTAASRDSQLSLARSLLDLDYNKTVRLFISKSSLNWNFNSFTFDALCCGRSLTELLLHLFDYYNLYHIFNLNIINVLKCFREYRSRVALQTLATVFDDYCFCFCCVLWFAARSFVEAPTCAQLTTT